MGHVHKVGRLASVACSILVGLAFVLPSTMTGRGAGIADDVIAAGYFLLPMAGAAIVAMSMAIWGGMEATRGKQKFEPVIFAPMIIVLSGVVMLFVVAALRDSFN
jgi:hypothetical protein